ncbi:hypothetical protein QE152_g38675 [Popillia japonica]|uniref:Uncharacterized protein n=1 Tax=Popillia japonica TaxID=7064 RepID=A0AAW1HWP3_POPJA
MKSCSHHRCYLWCVSSYSDMVEGENASKKIETLPVDYVRLALESSEEISLFEEALRRFNINFNAKGDDIDAVEDGSPPPKIKCIITPSEEQSSMVRRKPNKLKLKLLENRLVTPASSSSKISEVYDDANKLKLKLLENRLVTPASSSSKISEVYDDAADDHN